MTRYAAEYGSTVVEFEADSFGEATETVARELMLPDDAEITELSNGEHVRCFPMARVEIEDGGDWPHQATISLMERSATWTVAEEYDRIDEVMLFGGVVSVLHDEVVIEDVTVRVSEFDDGASLEIVDRPEDLERAQL